MAVGDRVCECRCGICTAQVVFSSEVESFFDCLGRARQRAEAFFFLGSFFVGTCRLNSLILQERSLWTFFVYCLEKAGYPDFCRGHHLSIPALHEYTELRAGSADPHPSGRSIGKAKPAFTRSITTAVLKPLMSGLS